MAKLALDLAALSAINIPMYGVLKSFTTPMVMGFGAPSAPPQAALLPALLSVATVRVRPACSHVLARPLGRPWPPDVIINKKWPSRRVQLSVWLTSIGAPPRHPPRPPRRAAPPLILSAPWPLPPPGLPPARRSNCGPW